MQMHLFLVFGFVFFYHFLVLLLMADGLWMEAICEESGGCLDTSQKLGEKAVSWVMRAL